MSHHDEPIEDPLPQLIAELDQAIAMAPQLARVARGWQDAFMDEGFTTNQALFLTAVQLKDPPFSAPQ